MKREDWMATLYIKVTFWNAIQSEFVIFGDETSAEKFLNQITVKICFKKILNLKPLV